MMNDTSSNGENVTATKYQHAPGNLTPKNVRLCEDHDLKGDHVLDRHRSRLS